MVDYNKQIESLSDRLNKIDQYSKETTPEALNYLTGLQRPAGASPLTAEAQKLSVGTLAKDQYDKGLSMLTQLLGLQQKDEQNTKDETYRQENLKLSKNADNRAQEEFDLKKKGSVGNLSLNPDGSLQANGELDDIDANLKSIYEGNFFLKDLTPSERSKISARAQRYGIKLPDEKDQEGNIIRGVIDRLKSLYDGNPDPGDELSMGALGGTKTDIMNFFTRGNANINASTYNENKEALVRQIMSLVGEKGIMTDGDAKRIRRLLPKTSDSAIKAKQKWDEVYAFLENKYGKKEVKSSNNDPLGLGI